MSMMSMKTLHRGIGCISRCCSWVTPSLTGALGAQTLINVSRTLALPTRSLSTALGDCIANPDLDTLAMLIQEARGPDRRGRPKGVSAQRRSPNSDGAWPCHSCKELKPKSEFCRSVGMASGIQSYCRDCSSQERKKVYRTLRGNAQCLAASARLRAKLKGLECSVSHEDILDMLWHQQARCHYSGVELEYLQPNSHWRASLERVCNHSGYTTSNCVLIAAEFNTGDCSRHRGAREIHGTSQWSRAKVLEVPSLQRCSTSLVGFDADLAEARRSTALRRKRISRVQSADGSWPCTLCGAFKCADDFYSKKTGKAGIESRCRDCSRSLIYAYARTLRGNVSILLQSARHRAARRGHSVDLTADFLLDTLWKQEGRCFYSRVPLEYKTPHSDWRMSLERLDNDLGYTIDNSVLVAAEFNTPDNSRNTAVTPVSGTAQWSQAKVAHVWGETRPHVLECLRHF